MNFQTLNLLYRCSKEYSHKNIRRYDLSDTEYMICSFVQANAGCSQDDAAKTLRLDKTTTAKAIQKLEEKGLLSRIQNPTNRRKKILNITEAGIERIADLMGLHDKWLAEIQDCLTQDEQKQFDDICLRLLQAAEALVEKQNNDRQQELSNESRQN